MARIGEARTTRGETRAGTGLAGVDDAELLVLVGRAHADAFTELYDRYGSTAYRLAYRITRDQQHAEAIVQELFLTVWDQASRFDAARARPSTWLLTITHHKAVDLVRREQLRRAAPSEGCDERADASVDLPHEVWLGVQRERVQLALASLSEQHRELIELAYFGGYSQTQLAQKLEQPLGTIKSRTGNALGRLRSALELDGITAELAFV